MSAAPLPHAASTLHEAFTTKLAEFSARRRISADDAERRRIDDEETEYVLATAPFIRDHENEDVDDDDPVTIVDDVAKITKRGTKKQTFMKYLYSVENVETQQTVMACTASQPKWKEYVCECGGAKLADISSSSSYLVCESCGKTSRYDEINFSSYTHAEKNNGITIVNHLAYKRINHFCEWLNSLQGKEGTDIPTDVIEAVKSEFKKNRVSATKDIKPAKVREYLKKLKLNKYYENVNAIANTLSGVPAPRLPPELESRLKDMFAEIQAPFDSSKPPDRKNFLSYSYVLHKFCELLGEDQYLVHFPLLKSPQKLYNQDAIWKKMCALLRWEFIPSI